MAKGEGGIDPLIHPPNFTMTPNAILDEFMSRLTGSEFKVLMAIVRNSLGWHERQTRPISLTGLQKVTGVSRETARKSVLKLDKMGLLDRSGTARGTRYTLRVGAPEPVTEPAPDPDPGPETESGGPDRRLVFEAVADACGLSTKVMTPSTRGRVARAVSVLAGAGVTPEVVNQLAPKWRIEDWRGRRGDKPTPEQLVDFVGDRVTDVVDESRRGEYDKVVAAWVRAGGKSSGVPKPPPYEEWVREG